jgi:hypothetical protein
VGLFDGAVVAQVAAQREDVGVLGHRREDGLQHALRVLGAVDVADGGHAYHAVLHRHGVSRSFARPPVNPTLR